ncbi:MAG: hypothetical protein J1E83_10595, partial [Lachnospiraceae bacterium]|nr:hypothetical protein [Lachnospiraceae bacterium]
MNIIQFFQENIEISICIGLVVLLLLLFIFRIEGFVSLLGKALGTVLQQICSLIIETICLLFKIINCLEVYVVLLIDALTGKTSSNGKIASLAIGVLSIASFYTTYSGMGTFIDNKTIAFLVTLGIQAILLSTSLRINDVLNYSDQEQSKSKSVLMYVIGILCLLSCFLAYALRIFDLSYSVQKNSYYILYIIIIILVLILGFQFIDNIIKADKQNLKERRILFIIYFIVLSISSFFSYNAFVPIMYPESIKNIDDFQSYKVEVIELLEKLDNEVDSNYYESVKIELEKELNIMEKKLNDFDNSYFLSDAEKVLYDKSDEFEYYIYIEQQISDLKSQKVSIDNDWDEYSEQIVVNSGGIGRYTLTLWEEANQEYLRKLNDIETKIEEMENECRNIDQDIIFNVEQYKKIDQKIKDLNYSDEISYINTLLKKEKWSIDEKKLLEENIFSLERIRLQLVDDELTNNYWSMIEVYYSYIEYKNQYSNILEQILSIDIEN